MSSSHISSSHRQPESPYRPRNPGHDYYGVGTYLITLVVSGREGLLSHLGEDAKHPEVHLTPLGEMVREVWNRIPSCAVPHGNQVVLHGCVCMPDHFHGVLEVLSPLTWCLGNIIQAFKSVCTTRWQQQLGMLPSRLRPIPEECYNEMAPVWLKERVGKYETEGDLIRSLSTRQRQEYYLLVNREHRPLFDDNYDDTVCMDARHLQSMIAYVEDNPRRAILRRLLPDMMRRCLHLQIGGHSYGAFGNLFLLRWVNKVQVMCHRRHPVSGQPYETTSDYFRQHEEWIQSILNGATVIVTPGISPGEQRMKNECLENGYPLILIQKEPIGPYWKPERQRFEACVRGALLILDPWGLDEMEDVDHIPAATDYSRFHNLNTLASEICAFDGNAKIIKNAI